MQCTACCNADPQWWHHDHDMALKVIDRPFLSTDNPLTPAQSQLMLIPNNVNAPSRVKPVFEDTVGIGAVAAPLA
jgi:hypothetical protein